MKKNRVTLEKYLEACRIIGEDRDIYVDGIDSIAYCGGELTDEGRKHFAKALELPVEDGCVVSDNDDDYDDENEDSALQLAWELLSGIAGYCPCEDFDKWFIIS